MLNDLKLVLLNKASSVLIASMLLAAPSLSFAEEDNKKSKWQAILQIDNDLFSGSDRDYTSGVRFAAIKQIDDESVASSFLKRSLSNIVTNNESISPLRYWLLPQTEDVSFAHGIGLSQLLFTPEDFSALSAPEGERPYAGWLGLEYSLHARNSTKVNSVTLSFGTTGENSFAEESQRWIHENISNSPIFQGWDSQIPSEVTVNLNFDHKQRIFKEQGAQVGLIEFDGYYESGVSLGNFRTDAYIGGLIRAGINLPSNYSTPRVQLGSFGHNLFGQTDTNNKRYSLLGFIGLRSSLVAHDITLDGPIFREFDTGVESETWVNELLLGFGARYLGVGVSFTQTIRSDEFDGQTENQIFGSLMLRVDSIF